MSFKDGRVGLDSEKLKNVAGGAVWKPICPNCKKEMPGGADVIRISAEGAEHLYFCAGCAGELLNSGQATIDTGYEHLYEKYEQSTDSKTGNIIYGWRKINK